MSIISLAIDTRATAPIRDADYGAPKTVTNLDVGTIWVVAGDGSLLVIWHLTATALW